MRWQNSVAKKASDQEHGAMELLAAAKGLTSVRQEWIIRQKIVSTNITR